MEQVRVPIDALVATVGDKLASSSRASPSLAGFGFEAVAGSAGSAMADSVVVAARSPDGAARAARPCRAR